jgi:hypothetical protein
MPDELVLPHRQNDECRDDHGHPKENFPNVLFHGTLKQSAPARPGAEPVALLLSNLDE